LNASAELNVACRDVETRKDLVSVLTPDNEGGPRGLRVSLSGRGKTLEILVESETVATAFSTSIAFLRDIALFQEVSLLSRQARG
jgi:hypothetical protein